MAKVRLAVDVDPDLERRIKVMALRNDMSVNEWIEETVRREAQQGTEEVTRVYIAPGISVPPPGSKPKGITNPPRLRGTGGTVADAVIEDRR